jgi:hypothetical protein
MSKNRKFKDFFFFFFNTEIIENYTQHYRIDRTLQNITELTEHYRVDRTLQSLQNITEHYRTLYRPFMDDTTLQNITEHCKKYKNMIQKFPKISNKNVR